VLRTLITFAAALFLLLAIFFFVIVWRAQPNRPTTQQAGGNQNPIPVTPAPSVIGNGTHASWQSWKDGRLESEFSVEQYTPNKDGSFEVAKPVDIFYLSDGQCLKVIGDSGHLNCETPAQTSITNVSSTNMSPQNGFLQNVRIELYKDASFTRPTLWMTTNNIHFDKDHYRIYTESYDDPVTKQTVPADQVPVTIRGDEYEFDGNGLTLIWNSKTGRLQRLEVNHGKRLEIKNPTKISLPGMAPAQTAAKVAIGGDGSAPTNVGRGLPRQFDSWRGKPRPTSAFEPGSKAKAIFATDRKSAPPEPPTLYRAVFNDNVKISDEARTLATADVMLSDFLQGSHPANPQPTVPPVAPNPPSPAAPAVVPAPAAAGPAIAATSPTTKPTTKPINGPVTINWTGKLLVTPLESQPPMMPIKPGQSVVRLQGNPVHLSPEGSDIFASTATYRSPDGAVQLETTTDAPVRMTRTNGQMTLETRGIDYKPETSLANLHGASHLTVPVGKDSMTVVWQQQGQLHMVKQPGQSQPSGVDHVDLTGDVDVKHPQFTLNSRELQLELAPEDEKTGTGGEQLKQMTAIDAVKCRLHKDEGIDSDQLVIKTQPNSKQTVIHEVIADGNVTAFDPDQTITAGHLHAYLTPKPATRPVTAAAEKPSTNPADADTATAVDLESLDASDHVHARLKNNATADADQLHIRGSGKDQQVILNGAQPATLADGKGASLAGRNIQLQPAVSGVRVIGPGTLKTIRRSSSTQPTTVPAQPPKPIIVTWVDSLTMLGNGVDVVGQVHVQNTDPNGTLSDVTGDTAHLDLADAPKNPAASQPIPPTKASSDDSSMGGKQLVRLTLTGHIIGNSDLIAPDGGVLRRGRLHCDQLIYTAGNGQAVIPGPGKMFVENHLADKTDPSGGKGAMAISWQKQMIYDQAAHTITFTGSTIVGFQQDADSAKPGNAKPANAQPSGQGKMNLLADQVVVTLSSAPAAGNNPAPRSQQKMQVSKMQAIGSVRVIATGAEMTCVSADYDPASSILTANGDENQEVQVTAGNVTGSFSQVKYDSALQEIRETKGSHIKSSN
jgi:hypothetical protein